MPLVTNGAQDQQQQLVIDQLQAIVANGMDNGNIMMDGEQRPVISHKDL